MGDRLKLMINELESELLLMVSQLAAIVDAAYR